LWGAIYYALVGTAYWQSHLEHDINYASQYLTFLFGSTSNNSAVFFWIIVTFLLGIFSLYLTRRHRHWVTFGFIVVLVVLASFALRSIPFFRANSVVFLASVTAGAGILAFLIAEFYRRSYRYYITNLRIAMIRKFMTYNELYMRYENIVDVDVHVSVLGRIFSFGNVVPITAAGLGTGMNVSGQEKISGSVSVKGTDVPRALPSECFYGVKHPYLIRNAIADYVNKSSSSYELKQIQSELKAKAL
jgi:hypothetical protein